MTILYLVNNLAWSAGGLLVGYILGRVPHATHPATAIPDTTEGDTVPDSIPPDTDETDRQWWRPVLGVVLVILAIASVVLIARTNSGLVQSQAALARITACQTEQNQRFAEALRDRSRASSDQLQAALDQTHAQLRFQEALADSLAAASNAGQPLTNTANILASVNGYITALHNNITKQDGLVRTQRAHPIVSPANCR